MIHVSILSSRAVLALKQGTLISEPLHWRSPAPCARNEPALRRLRYSPGTTNLRSSAFICGSFFAGAPYSKDSDRINRMDRINPSTNPVHPVQSGSSFSAAPDINRSEFIKVCTSQNSSLRSYHIPPSCAGGERVLRRMKSSIRKRTRMTRIGRIFMDFFIRAYPCHPCHPCSTAASLSAEAPQINILRFIKSVESQKPSLLLLCKFSMPSLISEGFIRNTFSGLGTTLYTDRMKSSYARGNA
ncbi:hypothetical protein [Candidatus Methanoperedens nitratireducens]|uniref:hypothetical protein n=1 Tax=Candidatus Methanoperedens nitratireducens TaxID=1392998 RepID=UPI001177BB34|nr:hypothetical protein [Candidatus Methanoperedens nitroreducens]